jgi:hypothetical protein
MVMPFFYVVPSFQRGTVETFAALDSGRAHPASAIPRGPWGLGETR